VEEILAEALEGNIQYGVSHTVGVREGYLDFIADDPGYYRYLPQDMQGQFKILIDDIRAGRVNYTIPPL
jgi:simple sugar transport system substrate-binding protein